MRCSRTAYIAAQVSAALIAVSAHAATLNVPSEYPTIQAGVDAAAAGDTVAVYPGLYREHYIWLPRSITITGVTGHSRDVVIDAEQAEGIFVAIGTPYVRLEHVTLQNGAGDPGGAVYFLWVTSAVIANCWFERNTSPGSDATGGAIRFAGAPTSLLLSDCTFVDNKAKDESARGSGGAVMVSNGASATMERCLFFGNVANIQGGAVTFTGAPASQVSHCTLVGNVAPWGSALVSHQSVVELDRCIIASNAPGRPVWCPAGTIDLSCSDVFGNEFGDWVDCLAGLDGVNGNFSAAPLFCDLEDGDFTLASDSPCLPGNHPDGVDCGLIGALGQGCGTVSLESKSWGQIKGLYR